MKVHSLRDDDQGTTTIVTGGHVDPLDFAKRIDTDDVESILGYEFKGKGSYPSKADEKNIAKMTRHTYGRWTRMWVELREGEPGAQPFTVVEG